MLLRRLIPLLLVVACGPSFSAGSVDAADATSDRTNADGGPTAGEAGPTPLDGAGSDGDADNGDAPPVIDGLLLWLEGDLGVTQSSSGVSNWADQSGNHLDARQPDPVQQPTWAMTGLLGRPALLFNAENFLSLPGGFADFSRGISLFAIVAMSDVGTCVDVIHLSNGPEIDDIALGRHDGQALYEVLDGVLHGDAFSLGRVHLVSVVHDRDGTASLRLDSGDPTVGMFELPSNATRLSNVVGRSLYGGCGSVHGGIAEILVYRRALGPIERTAVENYLQNRWMCCR